VIKTAGNERVVIFCSISIGRKSGREVQPRGKIFIQNIMVKCHDLRTSLGYVRDKKYIFFKNLNKAVKSIKTRLKSKIGDGYFTFAKPFKKSIRN
jgi:hypothetical protein